MPEIVVLGAGPTGLAAGMMLARDGHHVTVLERDAAPVPDGPDAAWDAWSRDGVRQFRQAHFLQGRGRHILEAELPDVREALTDAGALELAPVARMPDSIADREPRPGDDRLATCTARRPTLELALARAAEAQPGMEVRRGVSVSALETRRVDGRVHVTGVRADGDGPLAADLVVDAMGRGSALPRLLADAGADPLEEESEDNGFAYYTRFFRSSDGRLPVTRTGQLTHLGCFSILIAPADAGTWSVTIYVASGDRPLKRVRDAARWAALVRACPLHAHWIDGEPLTEVMPMGGATDRFRRLRLDGDAPVAGLAGVGDAWVCTNPSLGRGITIGLEHAAALRRVVRAHGGDPGRTTDAWQEATDREVVPWYRATLGIDRARRAELEAIRAGRPVPVPPPDDLPGRVRAALPVAMCRDAEVFRAGLEISNCLAMPQEVFARPGLAKRVLEAAGGETALPGPAREEVLELVA